MSRILVECYAGYRGEQRPLRFTIGGQTLQVLEIQDQWYSPDAMYFRVHADDSNLYLLRHDEARDEWTLEGFRAPRA
jgi:hypothetical protein